MEDPPTIIKTGFVQLDHIPTSKRTIHIPIATIIVPHFAPGLIIRIPGIKSIRNLDPVIIHFPGPETHRRPFQFANNDEFIVLDRRLLFVTNDIGIGVLDPDFERIWVGGWVRFLILRDVDLARSFGIAEIAVGDVVLEVLEAFA